MTRMEFTEVRSRTQERMAAARKAIGDIFEWYPYDSVANLLTLEKTFGSRYLDALDAAPGKVVADIGCADGELAFFLESLGCVVDAIDYPDSNHNRMRAVRALKEHFVSGIGIAEVDLDTQFRLPRARYDLVVFLGILYHLKNPMYALEQIAKRTRYCIMSTRVARYFPDDKPMPQGQPIAYLVGEEELNKDNTNFWIFSHPGLKRLFERTHWKVLEYASAGDDRLSTPSGEGRDERVYCLLESHYGMANVDLLQGWHPTETQGTRWVEKRFSARINLAARAGPDRIRIRVYVPEDLLARFGPRRLEMAIDGKPLEPAILDRPEYHEIVRRFQPYGRRSIVLSCELDRAIPPDERDRRERALVVSSLDCE